MTKGGKDGQWCSTRRALPEQAGRLQVALNREAGSRPVIARCNVWSVIQTYTANMRGTCDDEEQVSSSSSLPSLILSATIAASSTSASSAFLIDPANSMQESLGIALAKILLSETSKQNEALDEHEPSAAISPF